MLSVSEYREEFINYLQKKIALKEPKTLYDPINYILELGGKRLRPVLALMTTDIFESDYKESMAVATAIEVFHNFSLVHDDIMDDAPLRRGNKTVHEKWDTNTAILSGDAMLILAYQFFENYEAETFKKLAKLFSKTALEVCEGQQYDVDFETRNNVTVNEYIKMISYKTAVLVAAAMKMGAIVAKASEEDCHKIYEFGLNLGIAFQLQDDYLDAFGDPNTFGKQVGGDIIENKKTYLYIKALEQATIEDKDLLEHYFQSENGDLENKIIEVKRIFTASGSDKTTQRAIKEYTQQAFLILDSISISHEKKQILIDFGTQLMNRSI